MRPVRRWVALMLVLLAGSCDPLERPPLVRDERGCPRSVGGNAHIDWVPALAFRGGQYDEVSGHLAARRVGAKLGEVRCRIADVVRDPSYDLQDGEATFLDPGTALHALKGMDPSFRIVVMEADPTVYERFRVPGARTGRDLLPFDVELVHGAVVREDQQGREIGVLDKADARSLTRELRSGVVDADASKDLGEGKRLFLDLVLPGQPPVTLVLFPKEAIAAEGLRLSDEVLAALAGFF